jgi:pimeloyl-ACP methyl ester carboxylesterase
MRITTRQSLESDWDKEIVCPDQYDPAFRDSVWGQMLETDPTGAGWGPGLVRSPTQGSVAAIRTGWGELARAIQAPTLLTSGEYDSTVSPDDVRALYEDLRTPKKAFAALACSSHGAYWETRHTALFQASAEWLLNGTVNGEESGIVRIGD